MGRTVLVIGSGGREHALAETLAGAASVDAVESAPGNPGTGQVGPTHPVDVGDPEAVADLAEERDVDLVVVGPEAPLVAGVADVLAARDIAVFGPEAGAAELEGSKAFARGVLDAVGLPGPRWATATEPDEANKALEDLDPPYVVKADGLAGGKGVRICDDLDGAREAVEAAMVDEVFGEAGQRVVVEEFLEGPEVSVFGICDGEDVLLLPPSRDFKRVEDGDEGANTGGMGAVCPVPDFTAGDADALADDLFRPVLAELADRGRPYRGLLYAGLKLTGDGPRVLEFNCRFGDPEAQVVLPLLSGDLGELLWAAATGSVGDLAAPVTDEACVTVVLASGGYPGEYRTGLPITGIEAAAFVDGVSVFHAGTAREGGQLVTGGGRVLNLTGRADTIAEARDRAYTAAQRIIFANKHFRTDIAAAEAGE